jgi:hypothetical protein
MLGLLLSIGALMWALERPGAARQLAAEEASRPGADPDNREPRMASAGADVFRAMSRRDGGTSA